jgi:SAM-dependent methyltransferase
MANTQYQLAGNAPQLYERETVHTLGRPLAELMFAHVSLHAGDRLLDAACGTGIVTRVAVQRCGNLAHIVGVDLNPGMLDVARVHTPTTGIPVEWRQGDAATSCLSRYTLQDATTLRTLVDAAGFGATAIRVLEVRRRMPSSAASVVEAMARAPYARDVAAVEEDVRQAIGQEVSAALHVYRDGDDVVIPHRSHLVQAQGA